MIIRELVKAYDRLVKNPDCKISSDGFAYDTISNVIVIDKEGNLIDIVENPSKEQKRVPENLKKNTTEAWYLIDSVDYVLGLEYDKGMEKWIEALDNKNLKKRDEGQSYITKFELFREKNLAFLQGVESDMARAMLSFLSNWKPILHCECDALFVGEAEEKRKGRKIEGRCAFALLSVARPAYEDEAILECWKKLQKNIDWQDEMGQCAVTGEMAPLVKNHKPIKLSGPQGKDAYLISLDKASSAYQSYGKLEGYNSPMSRTVMNKYTAALTYFYRVGSKNKVQIGDDTLLFWAECDKPYEETVFSMLGFNLPKDAGENVTDVVEAIESNVSSSLEQMRRGTMPDDIEDDVMFHLLLISPNASRLSIRRHLNSTFGSLKSNVEKHQDDMSLTDSKGKIGIYPFWKILDATVSTTITRYDKRKEGINPSFYGTLLDAVLKGTGYPFELYAKMVERVKTDHAGGDDPRRAGTLIGVTKVRTALIKAYLTRKNRIINKSKEDNKMSLDYECKEEGYILGRLFAVLEKVQRDAISGINATIKDRYFASACATPAAVFPVLMIGSNYHLAKLEDGASRYYGKMIGEILAAFENSCFPKQLNLEQQGGFILGYYHQNADLWKSKTNNENKTITEEE